jgi:nucleoside-diphosphate-sugar epimerase
VVGLNIKAAHAPSSVSGKMFNAGNGGRVTIQQCWDLLQKFEGVDIPALYAPPREGDVRDSQADTTAAVAELGHAPGYTFEEGLRLTLEWYKNSDAG